MEFINNLGILLWIWLIAGFFVGFWTVFVEKEKFMEAKEKDEKGDSLEDEIVYNIFQSRLATLAATTLLGFISVYAAIRAFFISIKNKKKKQGKH